MTTLINILKGAVLALAIGSVSLSIAKLWTASVYVPKTDYNRLEEHLEALECRVDQQSQQILEIHSRLEGINQK